MAIQWGSWVGSSPRRIRLGVDFTSAPKPSGSDTAVTVKADVYVGTEYRFYDANNTFTWSGTLGSGSGKRSIDVPNNGQQLISSLSKAVSVSTSPTGVTVSASLTGVEYVGGSLKASVTAATTIQAKPNNKPAVPTAMNVTRLSDTSHRLTWSAVSTPDAPVTSFTLQYWSASTGAWATLGNPAAGTAAWTTGITKPNERYSWRIRSNGPGGSSDWKTSALVNTTPAKPWSVTAKREGSAINVSWIDMSPHNTQWGLYVSTGGAYTLLQTLPNTTSSYNVTSVDPTKAYTFEVEAIAPGPGGSTLRSARTRSNSVQLLSPPNAPKLVSPVGDVVDVNKPLTFAWTHNPVDTTAQTAYELEYRDDATTTFTKVTGTTAQQHTLTLPLASAYEWRVRTKGGHASFGAWSSLASFSATEAPAVGITTPLDGDVLSGNSVTVEWSGSFYESGTQMRWEAWLLDAAGDVIESASASDTRTSFQFKHRLLDDTEYRVRVVVWDEWGLPSAPTEVAFTTSFLLPPKPTLDATWIVDAAAVDITARSGTVVAGTVATASMTIERSIDGGETWETIVPDAVDGVGRLDPYPPLAGTLMYRATATSSLPSTSYGDPVTVIQQRTYGVWLNNENGLVVSVPYNTVRPSKREPQVALYQFINRRKLVSVHALGYEPPMSVDVEGVSLRGNEDLWDNFLSGPVLYRDATGRRFWGVISSDLTYDPRRTTAEVSFTVTEVEHA